MMIQSLTSPTDGPIGDSSLWVEYDGVRLLNQNDARPTDLSSFAELGHVHAHMLQFSGAIWYPMVYELPQAAKTAFGKQKRDRQFDRTLRYIDELKASWVVPDRRSAVLPRRGAVALQRHLRRRGQHLPRPERVPEGVPRDRPGQRGRAAAGQRRHHDRGDLLDHASGRRCDEFFANKEEHLAAYAERQRPVIEAVKMTWRHPEIDVLAEMKARIEPLLEESIYLATGVGGPVRFDLVGTTASRWSPLWSISR